MPGTTSIALRSFSHDQHHETDAAKRKWGRLTCRGPIAIRISKNKQVSVTAASGLRHCDLNDLW